MDKSYRPWEPFQSFLLPPSPLDWLPDGHLAYFLLDLVAGLDLSEIERSIQYKDPRGNRPFSPKMLTTLLLFAYCKGVPSSRKIEEATYVDVAFRVIAGGTHPDHVVISEFRRIHLAALERLFLQVLRICQKSGLAKLGHVALDGTKIQGNASKHKAMSYDRMLKRESELKAEIEALLNRAATLDHEEDDRFGKGGRGDELPEELRRRESRLQKIQDAKAALEMEAAFTRALELAEKAEREREKAAKAAPERQDASELRAADAEQRARDAAERARQKAQERRKQAEDRAEKAKAKARTRKEQAAARAAQQALDRAVRDQEKLERRLGSTAVSAEEPANPEHRTPATAVGDPEPKAQRNFTDPDSRIMKTKSGFLQGYNAQTAVDGGSQVILAYALTNQSPDAEHLPSLLREIIENCGQVPAQITADAGYWSEENAAFAQATGTDAYIATGRQKHGATPESAEEQSPAPPGKESAAKAKMRAKLATGDGKSVYSKRKAIVEPPYGQIKEARGFRRLLLRGIEKAEAEWGLICMTHNILKLFRAPRVMATV